MFGDTPDVAMLTHKKPSLASRKKAFPHKKKGGGTPRGSTP